MNSENLFELVLRGSVRVDQILLKLSKIIADIREKQRFGGIVVDLSLVDWIDVRSLILIYECIYLVNKKEFKIILPKNDDVVEYLVAWGFPRGLMDLFMIKPNDLRHVFIGGDFDKIKNVKDNKYIGKTRIDEKGDVEQIIEKYLPIVVFSKMASLYNSSLALREADKWKGLAIKSLLDRYLLGPSSCFATRIVFEAMMNAIRHPDADYIVTASDIIRDKDDGSPKELRMHWYDNGRSIIESLKEPLLKGKSDSIVGYADYPVKYCLKYSGKRGLKKLNELARSISSDIPIDKNANSSHVLLASLFPGTTCDPEGMTHSIHPDLGAEESGQILGGNREAIKMPGMGLHLLTNAVINIYHGSLTIRSGGYKLEIRKPISSEDCDYDVDIENKLGDNVSSGNMLSIRLPLKK